MINEIFLLKYFLSIPSIGCPSTVIEPLSAGYIPTSKFARVVFPEPVGPTIPIFSPGFISKSIPFNTSWSSYENSRPLILITPLISGITLLNDSGSISRISFILPAATFDFPRSVSNLPIIRTGHTVMVP